MLGILTRLHQRWRRSAKPFRRRRRAVGEIQALEQRQLLFFSATLAASPQILLPPNGRFVPVVISGTFTEQNHPVKPGTPVPQATYFVVDDYRVVQPRGPIALTYVGGNTYSFAFTLKLPAKRASNIPGGRHYYVSVAAHDADGWSGTLKDPSNPRASIPATLAVWVPINAAQVKHPNRK